MKELFASFTWNLTNVTFFCYPYVMTVTEFYVNKKLYILCKHKVYFCVKFNILLSSEKVAMRL